MRTCMRVKKERENKEASEKEDKRETSVKEEKRRTGDIVTK